MSWEGFQIACRSALRPAGFSPGDGEGFCVFARPLAMRRTRRQMAWTDEVVEQLKQHWIDGKSASQIASLLGNGVTRNAVIGKVHRLGLAGRAKTPNASIARPGGSQPRPRIAS